MYAYILPLKCSSFKYMDCNSLLFSLSSDKRDSKKRFHCHFQLPLPEQIIIFSLGKWEPHFRGQEIVAEVSMDTELPPQKIGTLTSKNKVLYWDEVWTNKFLKKSEELFEQVNLGCYPAL